jgi:hypothetical protein
VIIGPIFTATQHGSVKILRSLKKKSRFDRKRAVVG